MALFFKATDVATVYNEAAANSLGGNATVVAEDLSNVVDLGTQFPTDENKSTFMGNLIPAVGKRIFAVRSYSGFAPDILRDNREYGAALQKITVGKLPKYTKTNKWNFVNGECDDPNIFVGQDITADYFADLITAKIVDTIPEDVYWAMFDGADGAMRLVNMLAMTIGNAKVVGRDNMTMRLIDNHMSIMFANDFPSGNYSAGSGVHCVNLLKLWNDNHPDDTLTVDNCLENEAFLIFAGRRISDDVKEMHGMNSIFNLLGYDRFTPRELMHVVFLDKFDSAIRYNMRSGVFHQEFVEYPYHQTVPYWQGSGNDYAFGSVSEINIKDSAGNTTHVSGILAFAFDHDAIAISLNHESGYVYFNPEGPWRKTYYYEDMQMIDSKGEQARLWFIA